MTSNEKLLEAYETTVRDFEISLRETPWYYFKARHEQNKEIEKYEMLCNMTRMLTIQDSLIEFGKNG